MAPNEDSIYAASHAPICVIPSREAFDGLKEGERRYAHHMCRAAFHGFRIILEQTSTESPSIFDLLMLLYDTAKGDLAGLARQQNVSDQDFDHFLDYTTMFLANMGNYHSTGDEKFIPHIPKASFAKLCQCRPETEELFTEVATAMYSVVRHRYGYSVVPECASGFYPGSEPIAKEEVDSVHRFMQSNQILPENTRLFKTTSEPGPNSVSYELRLASAEPGWKPTLQNDGRLDLPGQPLLSIRSGDFAQPLARIIAELQLAKPHSENETQKQMISALIDCFTTGNHEQFKEAQKHWVHDHSPAVETVIGFIETYQDPHGIRGSWEGIVAVVNKEQSRKFGELVKRSSEFLVSLPWNANEVQGTTGAFEVSEFVKPDFTSLDTLGFTKSESPAGLNLPNFEDICQNVGSKNLEFGNVNNANPPDEAIPFIQDSDMELLRKHRERAFEVTVACHELLGHGSGRLFIETSEGEFNFDNSSPPINPLTKLPISSWYRPGETWSSVFGSHANAIEECRADGVALLLLNNRDILEIFGYTEESEYRADDITYAGYLNFIYGTLKGLPRWNPETKTWGQSHRRGKFALLRCMMNAGSQALQIIEDGDDIHVVLDRSKIESHVVPELSKFLLHLQVYKATANVSEGVSFFNLYSEVDERFAGYRPIVLAKEPPRIQYIQANTFLQDDNVLLKEYPSTREGLIQSWAERDLL
ncbi:dipeptidyl-peptidase III [Fusarium subglutinans]|uniref:Dipeptidyl peptidase 3 n=1 Tax=Gibberella subglutinans TaxID=42677 RepID=A0A8H5UYD3_GIBSU|nr:dipeptidyl-peptidase III [Fusarium subglutinans]KAF5601714.1 dipeptidyl-peptidase III [Fusarium subglutinans]